MGQETEITEVVPGVHSLGQQRGGHVHAFLLVDDGGLTLIDTLYDTDGHRVLEQIAAIGRTVRDLKRIILTHGHRSHLGGLKRLKELSGARVYAHQWEAGIIDGSRPAERVSARPARPLQVYPLQLGLALGRGQHPPCDVDENLKDGDHVGSLQVLNLPGHTPGSLAFHWPAKRLVIVGDAVVTWPDLEPGWSGFTLDFKKSHESLGKLSDLRDVEVVGVGHGPPITSGGAETVHGLLQESERRSR